jgi:hypothetical protein
MFPVLQLSLSKLLVDYSLPPEPGLISDKSGCPRHFGAHTSLSVFAIGIHARKKRITRSAMRVMLQAFATVFLVAFLANAILMAAGFSSQAVHSGSNVRLDASED